MLEPASSGFADSMTDATALLNRAHKARLDHSPEQARALLREAVEQSRAADDPHALGRALAKLGQIERDMGDTDTALDHYREAASIARAEDDALGLAHRLRHIADIHRNEDRLDLAEPSYDEALAIYRSREGAPPLDLANTVRPMAMLKEKQGWTGEAAALWAEAKALYARAGVEAGVAESAARLKALGAG
jgi:tetratricopeptide (TPR) repeat protein